MIQPDGKKKVLKISQGGGIRNCPWECIDMNLHETHQALRTLFGLGNLIHFCPVLMGVTLSCLF